jgi:protein-S-isoprenylcysteine O-methyltransferase Ste14
MRRPAAALYGVAVYGFLVVSALYTVRFLGNQIVPKPIAAGESGPLLPALIFDTFLYCLFAVQHSVMARQTFKRWWTKTVPPEVERSTYVLAATLLLDLLLWQWRPIPNVIWSISNPTLQIALHGVCLAGGAIAFLGAMLMNPLHLLGIQQMRGYLQGVSIREPSFSTPGLYRNVRHPIYFGLIVAFWATPHMTAGHLLFSILTTGYIFVGIFYEERDLVRVHGSAYQRYQRTVSMIVPRPSRAPKN